MIDYLTLLSQLPDQVLRGPLEQHLIPVMVREATPEKLAAMRLVCREWNAQTCALITHLAPSSCITDHNVARIPGIFPNLTSLDLGRCEHLTGVGAGALPSMAQNIQTLTLPRYLEAQDTPRLSAGWLQSILQLRNLTSLQIELFRVEQQSLAALGMQLPLLAKLRLRSCQLTGPGPAIPWCVSWRHLLHLRELDLEGTALPHAAILGELRQLEALSLRGCHRIGKEHLSHISSLANLKILDVTRAGLDDKAVEELEDCGHLTAVHIGGNPRVSIKALQSLRDALHGQVRVLGLPRVLFLESRSRLWEQITGCHAFWYTLFFLLCCAAVAVLCWQIAHVIAAEKKACLAKAEAGCRYHGAGDCWCPGDRRSSGADYLLF